MQEAGGEQVSNNNVNGDEVDLNELNEPVVQAVPASNPTQPQQQNPSDQDQNNN